MHAGNGSRENVPVVKYHWLYAEWQMSRYFQAARISVGVFGGILLPWSVIGHYSPGTIGGL